MVVRRNTCQVIKISKNCCDHVDVCLWAGEQDRTLESKSLVLQEKILESKSSHCSNGSSQWLWNSTTLLSRFLRAKVPQNCYHVSRPSPESKICLIHRIASHCWLHSQGLKKLPETEWQDRFLQSDRRLKKHSIPDNMAVNMFDAMFWDT